MVNSVYIVNISASGIYKVSWLELSWAQNITRFHRKHLPAIMALFDKKWCHLTEFVINEQNLAILSNLYGLCQTE